MTVEIGSDSQVDAFSGKFARSVITHRVWAILLTLIVCVAAGSGLLTLTYNPDSRVFLGSENPHRQALEQIEKTYSAANSVQFIIVPGNGTVFDRDALSLLQQLTELAWTLPHAFQVSSLANSQFSTVAGDDISIEDLYEDPQELNDQQLAELRDRVLSDESLAGRNVSEDAQVALATVLVQVPDVARSNAILEIAAAAREIADRMMAQFPQTTVRLSGGIMGDMAFAEAARRDSQTLVPLMLVVVTVTLLLALRSVVATVATLIVVCLSTAIAMGLGGFLGFSVNAATSGAPVIIMTLAIADCIHLLTSVTHYRQRGRSLDEAVATGLHVNFAPIAITSLTTAIGFLSLNFSESPPLRELGTIVAIGAIAAFFLSVSFLPALLFLLPKQRIPTQRNGRVPLRRMADFAIDKRRWLTAIFLVAIPLAALGITQLRIDDNYVDYFDESFAFRRDTDFMENRLAGLHVVQFSLPSGESQGVTRPDFLERMDAFADWLEGQDKVSGVHALSRSLKQVNRTLNGDDPDFERLPESRELAAQYLVFLELSLPPGFDLGNTIDVDRSKTLVTVQLSKASSTDIRRLVETSEAWLRENAPDMVTQAAGMSVAYAYVTERNIRAMLRGTLFALLLLSAVMLIYLRDIRIGLLSLVPNLIPAAAAFGLWGYFGGDVNLAVSVVGAMTLGIVVDDTVHFLTKFARARREQGLAPQEAIRATFELVGPALIITSATLFLGFSVLAMSGFAVSSQAGMMSAITIAVALIADLFFLPSLLLRFADKKP